MTAKLSISVVFRNPLTRELGVIAFIAVVGAAIRLPFFFPAVISWDESTLIIAGQSVVDGFLPYEIAWATTPVLVFWWFAAAIKLFGKTIPALRLAGFMWLVLADYLLYRSALLITQSRLGALFATAIFMAAASAYSLYVETGILAVLPMTGALFVLLHDRQQLRSVFLAGVLLGIACMFRLNLVYLCFVIGVVVCTETQHMSWNTLSRNDRVKLVRAFLLTALKKGGWFSVGVSAPLLLSFLPDIFSGHWHLWVLVKAAVAYSEEQRSFARNVVQTLHQSSASLMGATMWGAAILGALIIFRRWKNLGLERRSDWLLCGAFVVGSFLSIVMTGPVAWVYSTQLVPALSMFAAAAFIPLGKAFSLSKADCTKFVFGSILIVIAIFRTAASEWGALAQRLLRGEPLSYGIEYNIADYIADYIRGHRIEDFSLFMTTNHLVYWLLGRYPPTRLATHPTALGRPYIRRYVEPESHTTEDALRSVFRREPTFVVWGHQWWLDPAGIAFVEHELATTYTLVGQIGPFAGIRSREVLRMPGQIGPVQVYRRER